MTHLQLLWFIQGGFFCAGTELALLICSNTKKEEAMLKLSNIRIDTRRKLLLRIAIAVFIMVLVSVPGLMTNGKADANSAGSNISCGHDSICKSIEGNEFDLILYSSMGSEMVILYSKDKIGDLMPKVDESYYARAKGTVKDAIYYLSRHADYGGFRFKKAKRSTGFIRSQVIDGLYVAIPEYMSVSDNEPPEYRFSLKDGKLTVRITPRVDMSND